MQPNIPLTVAGLKRLTERIRVKEDTPVSFKETDETASIVDSNTGATLAYITKEKTYAENSLIKRDKVFR